MLKKPENSAHQLPKIILFSFVVINLIVAAFIAPDFGVSMDDDIESARSEFALEIYLGNLDEDPFSAFDSFGDINAKYYGTSSTSLIRFVEKLFFPDRNKETMVIGHYGHFVFFQIAVVAVFYLAKFFFNDWISLIVAFLLGTQPHLFGHAFINPKDIPLLAVFLSSVVIGFHMVEKWLRQDPNDELPEINSALKKKQRAFIIIFLALLVALWSAPWITSLAKKLVEYSYIHKDTSFLGNIFSSLTTSGSLEGYLSLIHIWVLEIFRWFVLLTVVALVALFHWANKHRLFGSYVNLFLLFAAGIWGFAISTRVIAIAAGGIVGLYSLQKVGRRSVFPLTVYTITASMVTVITWPFLWVFGLKGFFDALFIFSDYTWRGAVLFEGVNYGPHDLPARYLPKMMLLQFTEPVVILGLAGFLLSLYLLHKRRVDQSKFLLLYAWFGLPLLYTAISGSTVYNNFRQYFFITPPIFIMAGLIIDKAFDQIKKPIFCLVISVLILLPGVHQIQHLHPMQYIYYNSFAGGVQGAQGQYPLDYWNTSFIIAMEYLNENAPAGSKILVWKEDYHARIYATKYFTFKAHSVIPEDEYSSFDYAIMPMPSERYNMLETLKGYPAIFTVEVDNAALLSVLKLSEEP